MRNTFERKSFERPRYSLLDILSNRVVDAQRAEILHHLNAPSFDDLQDLPVGRAMLEVCKWMQDEFGEDWVGKFQEAMERTGIRNWDAIPPSEADLAWLANTSPAVPEGVPAGYESLERALCGLLPAQLEEVYFRLNVPRGVLPHANASPSQKVRCLLDWVARKGAPRRKSRPSCARSRPTRASSKASAVRLPPGGGFCFSRALPSP